jgi:putative aldouronate transport system permease protein
MRQGGIRLSGKGITSSVKGKSLWHDVRRRLVRDWQLYLFVLPGVLFYIVFHYMPLYGIQIAFKHYRAVDGISGSAWVGFKYFQEFFESYLCWDLIRNTLIVNLYSLIFGFPIPVIMALLLNRLNAPRFKKFTQTVIYIPHFISVVVLAGMLIIFLDPNTGFVNKIIAARRSTSWPNRAGSARYSCYPAYGKTPAGTR